MTELREELARMANSGRLLKAIIFDDEIDDDPTPPLEFWMDLREQLAELELPILNFLEENGHNSHHAPSLSLMRRAFEEFQPREDSKAAKALRSYMEYRSVLQKLKDYLEALDFQVTCSRGVPEIDPTSPPLLCLVDYQILPEGDDGDTATAFFRGLMESAQENDFPPPYVFLMSKALTEKDAERWARLAELAGLFRFNYGFLNKDKFNRDPLNLSFPLLHHLKHDSLSIAYFEQVRAISNEAQQIAKSAVQRIFQVTPPEFLCFKSRVVDEGGNLAQELLKVFSALFSAGLRESPAIEAKMGELETVFTADRVPVPYRQSRSALHRIYSEFLFQKCRGSNHDPQFADVYEIADDRFALIVSQECDLMSGGKRERKVDRVVAIEGVLRESEPTKSDGQAIVGKPIYFLESDKRMWLWWDVSSPLVIPLERFTKSGRVKKFHQVKRLVKRWELRAADAEQIQNLFSSAITRVGTEISPEYVSSLGFLCFEDDELIEGSPVVHIYRTMVGRKAMVAIAPESQVDLLSVKGGGFISPDCLTSLSGYVPIEDFVRKLGANGLMPFEIGADLRLTKVTQAYKNGKKAWKG
jgi:hypothetical protein